ncbi:MAG: Txe/YoeB family addiction module toxin [Candidatus Kapabacteria bacterium]|nr:Txe/YoeB family addiction module toxin [Candidatus Kapabacteria bacterium]
MWEIYYTHQARIDAKKIASAGLKKNVEYLLEIISKDPFVYPPKYEFLKGRLKGFISRRINNQHRMVYQIFDETKQIKILKMWTHYE